MAAKLPECYSAADIAAKTQQATGLKLSTSSVKRLLRKGLQHLTAKVVPMLTTAHNQARVRFAKLALRRERCSWRRVLITDSKYFKFLLLHWLPLLLALPACKLPAALVAIVASTACLQVACCIVCHCC